MNLKGRTTRDTVLPALHALSRGRDVTIVALRSHTQEIAARVVRAAKLLGIPCSNVTGSDPDLPRVRMRSFDEPVKPMEIVTPRDLMRVVVYDHSAVWERGSVRSPDVRTVDPLETDNGE